MPMRCTEELLAQLASNCAICVLDDYIVPVRLDLGTPDERDLWLLALVCQVQTDAQLSLNLHNPQPSSFPSANRPGSLSEVWSATHMA